MTAHLQLMSKARLVEIAQQQAKRADEERQRAAYWRRYVDRLVTTDWRKTPTDAQVYAETTREAQELLNWLGPDPDAENHRDVLERELEAFSPTKKRGLMPGPRCQRPKCNQRLNEHGLCSRCEHAATKRARAAA